MECPLHPDCCQGPEVHRTVFLQIRRVDSVLWGHSPCPQPPTERRIKRRLGPGAPMAHSWARAPTSCGLVGAPGSLTQGGTFLPAWESNSRLPPRRSLGKLPALGSSDNRYDLLSTYCTRDTSLHQPISVFAPHPARSAFWLRKLGWMQSPHSEQTNCFIPPSWTARTRQEGCEACLSYHHHRPNAHQLSFTNPLPSVI